jgi:hypothetical protein
MGPSNRVSMAPGPLKACVMGIASPASNYSELTASGWTGPTDPCNLLSNRGGNNHTHYEPTAPGMHHVASHMTKQTGQTHPGNYPRLNLGTSASISRHTQIQTHDPIRVFKALNNRAFRSPPRYLSGGIYAHAYSGITSTLTPSAPHSRDAATPVTVHLIISGLACDTRHYQLPTSEVYPDATPLLRNAALATGYSINKQISTTKGANTPQAGRLPVSAPPLRAKKKQRHHRSVIHSIRDSQSTAKTSPTIDSISPPKIPATSHIPVSEPRQIGRVGSRMTHGSHLEGCRPPSGCP